MGYDGWPDRVYLFDGGIQAYIEWKRPGKDPTPRQTERLKMLKKMGYLVTVMDDVEEAIEWLSGIHISIKKQLNGSSITELLQIQTAVEVQPYSSTRASAKRRSRSRRSPSLGNKGIFGEP
jgi:hypothetical protein